MFNLLAANLHDGNAHDLTSSLGLIGNSGSRVWHHHHVVENSHRVPGKKFLVSRKNSYLQLYYRISDVIVLLLEMALLSADSGVIGSFSWNCSYTCHMEAAYRHNVWLFFDPGYQLCLSRLSSWLHCKNGWTDQDAVVGEHSWGPVEHCHAWVLIPHREGSSVLNFGPPWFRVGWS